MSEPKPASLAFNGTELIIDVRALTQSYKDMSEQFNKAYSNAIDTLKTNLENAGLLSELHSAFKNPFDDLVIPKKVPGHRADLCLSCGVPSDRSSNGPLTSISTRPGTMVFMGSYGQRVPLCGSCVEDCRQHAASYGDEPDVYQPRFIAALQRAMARGGSRPYSETEGDPDLICKRFQAFGHSCPSCAEQEHS